MSSWYLLSHQHLPIPRCQPPILTNNHLCTTNTTIHPLLFSSLSNTMFRSSISINTCHPGLTASILLQNRSATQRSSSRDNTPPPSFSPLAPSSPSEATYPLSGVSRVGAASSACVEEAGPQESHQELRTKFGRRGGKLYSRNTPRRIRT